MPGSIDSRKFLVDLTGKFERGNLPSFQDLRVLLRLCGSVQHDIREAALALLLQPPFTNEIEYYRWILRHFPSRSRPIHRLPIPLIELICEVIGFLEKIPDDGTMSSSIVRLLKHLPPPAVMALIERPYPLYPFLEYLPAKTFSKLGRDSPRYFKQLWRHFRNSSLRRSRDPRWAQPTFSDLSHLWIRRYPSGRRCHVSKSRWRRVMRPLALPAAADSTNHITCAVLTRPFRHCEGTEKSIDRGWEHLLNLQLLELQAVRKLATYVSKMTRRVVLSWHNATLAAAGGWAFESIAQQAPSRPIRESLRRSVQHRTNELYTREVLAWDDAEHLWELWQKRLVTPKVLHALWESHIHWAFHSISEKVWSRDLESSRPLVDTDALSTLLSQDVYGWHGAVSPHQRIRMEEIIAWRNSRRELWHKGLITLATILREAQLMLDKGLLSHFVLPWIDKFFISSQREGDLEYLPALVKWIEERGVQPLILFWEDTAHAQTPSFQLALNRLRDRGTRFRGIGIFGTDGTRRDQAADIICSEHEAIRLFALRPYSDSHSPKPLSELLRSPAGCSLPVYDSSWKDNLCFIYVGTQVEHMLSIQYEEERHTGWIVAGGSKHPFGRYFRRRLRHRLLSENDPGAVDDSLSHAYSVWANLY